MKTLLLTAYFPPDTGSAANLFYELGIALVERGHRVTVITSMPSYHALGPLERYKRKLRIREKVKGMDVIRVATPRFPRHLMVGRALWQFWGALAFFAAGLFITRHNATIVYSPPLPLGLAAWGLKRLRRIPFILNVQDLFPQSIIDLGLLKSSWLIRFFEAIERFLYVRADAITVHSEGNRQHVACKIVGGKDLKGKQEKIKVIPNWVDTNFIHPDNRLNGFRQDYSLGDAFVVSFAGVLGYSQDLDVVLEAAHIIKDMSTRSDWRISDSEIIFLIVGDGVEKQRLQDKARQMGLTNVLFLPMQPREKYPDVLHASDVCLVTLHAEVKTPVVPSKILSIMAAGRPVVAAMNLDGDGPRLIAEARCGLCVPQEDPQALAEAILKLYYDESLREQLARNGRRYAEQNLSLDRCVERYEALLQEIV